jgi:nicotinamidase-related amidase
MKTQVHSLTRDHSPTTLLILDMISDFDFPDGGAIERAAKRIAPNIARLRERVTASGLATIFVNDVEGRWRSDLTTVLSKSLSLRSKGAAVVRQLLPREKDYFVMKPRHSAFYATPLSVLLAHLHTQTLILTGVSSHQCVLFTANDAHVRNFDLLVPSDCIAAGSASEHRLALQYFKAALDAQIRPSGRINLRKSRRSP